MTLEKTFKTKILANQSHFQVPLHTIFEQIAREHPNKNAVSFIDRHLTYQELNAHANQLAYWLIDRGIQAESRVAVCLRPGLEIIIALLAIQKTGAVYLPIDPDYPQGRIQSIFEDAAVDLTITQNNLIKHLGDILVRPYTLQQTKLISNVARDDNPQVNIAEDDTAYIFYTSGTTGKPKGIAISYKSFAYYVLSAINQFGMTPQDTILTIAKFSFSISLFDLMTSIISGGRLVVLPRDEIMSYDSLTTALEPATIVHMSPNLLKGLVRYIKKNYPSYSQFAGLRHVSSGGDIVPADLLEELKIIFSEAEIYVIYGCTEIACMGCCYLIPRDKLVKKSYIGKPFIGTEIVLLGDNGEPIANGEVGEICFKGPGVMKGYLNRPELNSNAFIKIDGATYFKTGDLARIDASGNLEYLGRRDFQIKLRGQRIELIEIESHLRQAPKIRDAVVTASQIGNRDKRLIAYITLEDPNSFSLDAIRAYLQDRLPDYMQPSGWIILDKMPLNVNLKIARKALPPATLENLIVTETYVAPRNEIEEMLVAIWQDVLDLPRVGIKDNFFNIGGNSLRAMNICMLAAEKGIEISPLQMVVRPTITALVEGGVKQYSEVNSSQKSEPSFGSIPELPPFILQFLYERDSPTPHHWNISRILVAQQHLSFDSIEKTFRYLGDRHDALRLRFDLDDDCWQAKVLASCQETLACKTVDLSNLSPEKQDEAIAEVAQACHQEINLTNGPIAYMILFELGKERSQELFFVVHHFSMDVISWKIFWLEFEMVYQRLEANNEAALSTSPTSFRAWTQVLRQYANSPAVETDARQWIQLPWSQVPALPKDLSDRRDANTNGSAKVVRFALSEWQTETLMRSGTHNLDVESILISSLGTALSQWQSSSFVYFDRLVHGRNVGLSEAELSRTLGCIISYAPTLLRIDTQTSVNNILLNVTEQLARQKDSGTSIDLYRYLGSEPALVRNLEALPRAEILFNYRGKVDDILERSKVFNGTRAIAGSDHDPEALRQYPLAFAIDLVGRQLEVRCVYSENIHQRETIEALCAEFLNRITAMQEEAAKYSHVKVT